MGKTFLAGDTHGGEVGDFTKLEKLNVKIGATLTKDDVVIILGYSCLLWNYSNRIEKWLTWLENAPWTTLVITGNHDNIPRFNKLDTMLAFDGVVGRMSSTVFHLKNGNIYNINGKSYFIMGGGFSIDKQRRTPGVTWWPEEMPNHEEYKLGIDSLNKVNHKVDYLLTHTCSTSEFDDICDEFGTRLLKIAGEEELRDYLEVVIQETQYLRHYYGHFHLDISFDKHQILYDELVLVK